MADENIYDAEEVEMTMKDYKPVETSFVGKAYRDEDFDPVKAKPSRMSKSGKQSKEVSKFHIMMYAIVVTLLLALVAVCIAFSVTTSQLQTDVANLQDRLTGLEDGLSTFLLSIGKALDARFNERSSLLNSSLATINEQIRQVTLKLARLTELNAQVQQFNSSYEQLNSNIRELALSTHLLFNEAEKPGQQDAFYPAASCAALPPSSPSGYYYVRDSDRLPSLRYCDMTRTCGNITGGWTRVVKLDMTDRSQQCPQELTERLLEGESSVLRWCSKNSEVGSCTSVFFSINLPSYSRVCGKIIGYQGGSLDSFVPAGSAETIEEGFVDGITLLYGNTPQHIWTFAGGLDEAGGSPGRNCPCNIANRASPNDAAQPPFYVGNDYFCDTGASGTFINGDFVYSDPLWDGAGCGPQNLCCSFNNPPWFYKALPGETSSGITMRVCTDEGVNNEDVAIVIVELYVQ